MTMKQSEAFERAVNGVPWSFVGNCCMTSEDARTAETCMNAMPHLLAVAKAAKAMVNLARQMERGEIGGTHVMATAANEAEEALSRLEAQ